MTEQRQIFTNDLNKERSGNQRSPRRSREAGAGSAFEVKSLGIPSEARTCVKGDARGRMLVALLGDLCGTGSRASVSGAVHVMNFGVASLGFSNVF